MIVWEGGDAECSPGIYTDIQPEQLFAKRRFSSFFPFFFLS